MKSIVVILVLFGNLTWTQLIAQKMSKAEKKELVKQAKKLKSNPQLLKNMLQELETLRAASASSEDRVVSAQNEARTFIENSNNLQAENERLKNRLTDLQQNTDQIKTEAVTQGYRLPKNGTVFRVQIGGYKKRDLSEYIDNSSESIQREKNSDGITEITVGQFTNYRKADELKKHLRAMGVKDAWIVPYKNGKRVLFERGA